MSEQQTKRDDGGPVNAQPFPQMAVTPDARIFCVSDHGDQPHQGMSRRDWLAGMAMQGMLANRDAWDGERHNEYVATQAYKIADAMIAEGKK
jgi:hypothetical protein